MSENRYIKGKDGKMKGSLPGSPNLPKINENVIPPLPHSGVQINSSTPSIGERLEDMNRLEKESNTVLSEGLAEISKAFQAIEDIYKERQRRAEENLEISRKRAEEAALAAAEAKANYERILAEEKAKAERRPINRLKKFLGIK